MEREVRSATYCAADANFWRKKAFFCQYGNHHFCFPHYNSVEKSVFHFGVKISSAHNGEFSNMHAHNYDSTAGKWEIIDSSSSNQVKIHRGTDSVFSEFFNVFSMKLQLNWNLDTDKLRLRCKVPMCSRGAVALLCKRPLSTTMD